MQEIVKITHVRKYSLDGKVFYDVNNLIELAKALPIITISMKDLEHNLYESCWGNDDSDIPEKMRTPLKIYEKKNQGVFFKKHYERAMKSDLDYPILIDINNNIIDGNHRLLKAFIKKRKFLYAIRFSTMPDSAILK